MEATPSTDTAVPTLQQAFIEAKAEHSAPAERAQPVSDGPESETADPSNESQPETSTEPAGDPSDLISDAEYQALVAKHPNDPGRVAKELKAVFTKKTQALAEQRKVLAPYADLIEAYEQDPVTVLRDLASQQGLRFADPEPQATTQSIVDDAVGAFRQALGPELDFLADKLAPAVQALAESVAGRVVTESVGPLADSQQSLLTRAAHEQTASVMQTFGTKHPDWPQHEAKIVELGSKLHPQGMDELEYLDLLYTLATKDVAAGETAKRAVAKMVRGAAEAEGKTRSVPDSQVSKTTNKPLTFREAYEEAKREHAAR